jgi:hypothetical protein
VKKFAFYEAACKGEFRLFTDSPKLRKDFEDLPLTLFAKSLEGYTVEACKEPPNALWIHNPNQNLFYIGWIDFPSPFSAAIFQAHVHANT